MNKFFYFFLTLFTIIYFNNCVSSEMKLENEPESLEVIENKIFEKLKTYQLNCQKITGIYRYNCPEFVQFTLNLHVKNYQENVLVQISSRCFQQNCVLKFPIYETSQYGIAKVYVGTNDCYFKKSDFYSVCKYWNSSNKDINLGTNGDWFKYLENYWKLKKGS